ncbi:GAD-like domain-containing protein [Pseudomonas sp. PSKL.D1]|uniref:GAD-like domain-containing protein n=1 Tax=Pseudomonas sp. PSKL.D1 TaxID=3029060 RepID=UPI0023813473|nr:GAD-like domain-containing protein [Pseudomonas sp. PSKL.D1]WDY59603.1 GAD-like domain-containing protein [Pseudomonas sp. PSKL.D1]
MDEAYSLFIEQMGEPVFRQEVPLSSMERYKGVMPEKLLEYWKEHGWCGYGEGLFWTVDPQEYEGVIASLINGSKLENRDKYHLVARGAFGDLYLFGENTGFSVKILAHLSRYRGSEYQLTANDMNREVQSFFLSKDKESVDFDDMFEPAKKKLGILDPTEMYGFVPALTFGGPCDLAHLEKVNAVEHLLGSVRNPEKPNRHPSDAEFL